MRHLNPTLERLEERVAPCLSIGLPIGISLGACGSGNPDGCTGSSARSCDVIPQPSLADNVQKCKHADKV